MEEFCTASKVIDDILTAGRGHAIELFGLFRRFPTICPSTGRGELALTSSQPSAENAETP
jgi:hypothetical protein